MAVFGKNIQYIQARRAVLYGQDQKACAQHVILLGDIMGTGTAEQARTRQPKHKSKRYEIVINNQYYKTAIGTPQSWK